MPLHRLRDMPAQDLAHYQRYTARRLFPGRRLELLLANLALVLARVNGNDSARLEDFLFDPPPDEDTPAPGATGPEADKTGRQRALTGFF